MNKKKLKINKKYIALIVVAFVLSISITYSVAAGISLKQLIADKAGEILGNNLTEQMTEPAEDFTVGAVPSPDVFNRMYFHAGFDSNSAIDISINQVATSSAANPAVAGYYCNGGDPVLVESNWYFDLQTSNDGWGSNWTIGTTTKTGDDSFTATSSATLMASAAITTSTTGFYDRDTRTALGTWYDGGGNATTTPWVLGTNDCIVVTSDMSGATSSDESFTAGGGESGYTPIVATFHADAVYR